MAERLTFAQEIERAANGPIEAVVIGGNGWYLEDDDIDLDELPAFAPCAWPRNTLLMWADARSWLDKNYPHGYGAPECPAITAWAERVVIFVSQYDGATNVCTVPRNPVNHHPDMPGGG